MRCCCCCPFPGSAANAPFVHAAFPARAAPLLLRLSALLRQRHALGGPLRPNSGFAGANFPTATLR
eukprot:534403-Lingulodinium_polyedra.AAC.1